MPFVPPCQIHASCVSVGGRGLLIVGPSGSGKSTLALQLMALGAELVADDRCDLSSSIEGIYAARPSELPQAIEARGLGLLCAKCIDRSRIVAVIDLGKTTENRLPHLKNVEIDGHTLSLLHNSTQTDLAAALFHFLKSGFHASMSE